MLDGYQEHSRQANEHLAITTAQALATIEAFEKIKDRMAHMAHHDDEEDAELALTETVLIMAFKRICSENSSRGNSNPSGDLNLPFASSKRYQISVIK